MPWYDKIPRNGFTMTMPGIGYGLCVDDYDISGIYYNTATMYCLCRI